jgi:probable F420-dependent oxidoreductase
VTSPSLAVTLSGLHRTFGDDARAYVDCAVAVEQAGADQVVLADHVVMGDRTDRYPFGRFPFQPEEPWVEPLTVLSAIAGATSRVRLVTGILIAPLRPAVLLAKTVATLDALSGGRVDLGVGVGWQPEEYEAVGVPFERRWSRLDDTMRACRALWRDVPATFFSPTVSFRDIYCTPLPAQERVPVWYGAAMTPRLAARIGELGDGWYPVGAPTADELRSGADLARQALADAGRDPAELGLRRGLVPVRTEGGDVDLPGTMAAVPELRAAGVTVFGITLRAGLETASGVEAYVAAAVRAFQEVG